MAIRCDIMVDTRFFNASREYTLQELATLTGAKPVGNNIATVHSIATLAGANGGDLTFFSNPRYLNDFRVTKGTICITEARFEQDAPSGINLLVSDNPYFAYARVADLMYPRESLIQTKKPISETAKIEASAKIGFNTIIEDGAEIGENTQIGHNVVIRKNVVIGRNCEIGSNVTISHSLVGDNVIIHNGAQIGQDGFGFAPGNGKIIKVPQLGRVIIGSGVEIGAGTTIDRGAIEDTIIGDGTKIDNLVQLGHNVVIGKMCFIAAQAGIAGSTHVGNGVMIGGQAGFAGHINIGDGASIAAQSGVMGNVEQGQKLGGSPAVEIRTWLKMTAVLKKMVGK